MTELTWDRDAVAELLDRLNSLPGALLPVLHGIQNRLGYVPEDSVPLIAKALNLSRAEVHGVIRFYHYFRTTPPGKRTVYVCRAESCQAMGAEVLEAHVKTRLGIAYHETAPDRSVSLEPVYCLGNCACSPSIMVGQTVHGRVTPEKFDQIMQELQESAP